MIITPESTEERARIQAARRVLLVGEMNPYGADPQYALYPMPVGCAGHRLCHKVLDLPSWVYMETKRVNLCEDKWSMPSARERAALLYHLHVDRPGVPRGRLDQYAGGMDVEVVVLCGRKVTEAFARCDSRIAFLAPFATAVTTHGGEADGQTLEWHVHWVSIPHPSGLSRVWNEPRAYERARNAVQCAAAGMWPA